MEKRERWRVIPGTDGFYEVSDLGRVRSYAATGRSKIKMLSNPKMMKPCIFSNGYPSLSIKKTSGRIQKGGVHVLVLESFVCPRPKGFEAAHLDGVKTNSKLTNLKWVTPKENQSHRAKHGTTTNGEKHGKSILTDMAVRHIKDKIKKGDANVEIAKYFGLRPCTISEIRIKKTYRTII